MTYIATFYSHLAPSAARSSVKPGPFRPGYAGTPESEQQLRHLCALGGEIPAAMPTEETEQIVPGNPIGV